ncbi:hypothetical protein GCM10008956_31950 [Deinococcus arenae]|uniref:RelA/SpoT domain-containing protein n=1 Tax=Deinococcus arenae TaxID=1452751 RepID=A0A8H9GRU4_9DEIO|nr:GTP pyrophosphokinase [Deinococcus arenae]AWT36997.1 GTP pyrophosphokinase [Deinococcus actinosclerus]GGM53561.1 hypothetical protein GCM10008956_31950 [Deinococcus arenae]
MTISPHHIDDFYENKKNDYEYLLANCIQLINNLFRCENITAHSVSGRIKSKRSLQEKIARKGKYLSLDEITDLMGIRIISYFYDDLDKIARLIEDNFAIDRINSIDKRKAMDPDRFGYMSMHYVVSLSDERLALRENHNFKDLKFEIQVRTVLQHGWAEVEHDLGYKLKSEIPDHVRRKFSQAASLLELSDRLFSEIREEIKIHEDMIAKRIESDLDTPINIDNLTAYLNSERYANYIRHNINYNDVIVNFNSEKRVKVTEDFAKASGFKTLKDLDQFLIENSQIIHLMLSLGYTEKENIAPAIIYQLAVLVKGFSKGKDFFTNRLKTDSAKKTYDNLHEYYDIACKISKTQPSLDESIN